MVGTSNQAQQQFEKRKEVVNKAVKICIECGNLAVLIDNYGIYCNSCNSRFKIEEEKTKIA